MNKLLKASIILSVLALFGCSDGSTININSGSVSDPSNDSSCEDECLPEDDPDECVSNKERQTCSLDDNGCYVFEIISCPDGKICKNGRCRTSQSEDPTIDNPPSEEPCTDECREGAKSCTNDGKSMVCGDLNNDGCLENTILPCEDGETCKNGVCTKDSDEPDKCTDECPKADQTQCSSDGKGVQVCGNFDADTCLEWSDATPCNNGATCNAGTCGCTNQCDTNGETRCDSSSNGFKTCTDTNGDGCLEWSSITACTNTQCQDGKCLCNHQCKANAKECSGDGYRTCTTDAEGCRVWSNVSPCKAGCDNGECKPEVVMAQTRYPANQLLSPITEYSVTQMKAIAAKQSRNGVHFAKIGDSHFAPSSAFMYCFASNKSHNLNGADFLENSIKAFQSDGTNSFSRDSDSAVVGWRVNDATSGKLKAELNTMNPRFAFIDYGSNDMGYQGYTRPEGTSNTGYFYTLEAYYKAYQVALDQMMSTGVIPIIVGTGIMDKNGLAGLNPKYFTPVFDALNRGMAEQYQIPYMNLMMLQDTEPLKSNNYGLNYESWFNGYLHHAATNGGCDFTPNGMKYGHNARNRYAIEQLDRAYRTVVQGEKAPDNAIPFQGTGKKSDPYIVTELGFTHAGNSAKGESNFSTYSCSSTGEPGPETYYKLTLTSAKKIRAFAVSSKNVDVDIHLLSALDSNKCMTRGDKWVEANLAAGTYYFVVDTCSGSGDYVFAVTECMSGDPLCGSKTVGG